MEKVRQIAKVYRKANLLTLLIGKANLMRHD